jgi:glycosyltransferase involved in cell wall biosynthesis
LDVVVLSAYPPAHYGTIARFTRWIPHLARCDINLRVLCPCSDDEFASFGKGDARADYRYHRATLANQSRNISIASLADVVVLHRGLFPFGPWQRPTFEKLLARLNPRLVYDFYDAIWLQRRAASPERRSLAARWLTPPDQVERLLALARTVTVSGEYLAEYARQHSREVHIIPMLLDPEDYPTKAHLPSEPVVLGWMGNRYNIRLLMSMAPALRAVAAQRPILLRVVSAEPVSMAGVPVESLTHPWTPENEVSDLMAVDIGLLPLADTPYERGKSPLKLLQYAAAGLPCVASPVAIDPKAMVDGKSILFARTDEEWVSNIIRLVDDHRLRARFGRAARHALERHYSFSRHASTFAAILRAVAESQPARRA